MGDLGEAAVTADADVPAASTGRGDVVHEGGTLGPADGDRQRAARMERTAGRRIDRVRRLAADRVAPPPAHRKVRHGVEQHTGVGVARPREQSLGLADLDEAAEVHDADPVGHEADYCEVVGDHQIGEAEPVLQIAHEVENLGLDRHVEGRGRLVADDEIGVGGDRARNRDSLALAAGEFVRKLARVGSMKADELEQFADPGGDRTFSSGRGLPIADAKRANRLGDDAADPPARIERPERVLEDHLDAPPDRAPRGLVASPGEIDALDQHLPGSRLEQPDNHSRQGRFPRPGFPDKSECLAAEDREVHAVDGCQQSARLVTDEAREPGAGDVEDAPEAADRDDGIGAVQVRASAATAARS